MSTEQATASRYPEHEKLAKVSEESQTIGAFLDMGLPALNLVLYEPRLEECTCDDCERGETVEGAPLHSEAVEFKDGKGFYRRYRPTMRSIKTILAEHFDIDQDKIDREKEQMLADLRGAS